MNAETRVDTATIRFSQQVERYACALREADECLRREELKNPPTDYEVTLADPEGNPTTLGLTAHQERLERAEHELAQVRRELSSSSVTAITVCVPLDEGTGQQRGGAGLSEERRCPIGGGVALAWRAGWRDSRTVAGTMPTRFISGNPLSYVPGGPGRSAASR